MKWQPPGHALIAALILIGSNSSVASAQLSFTEDFLTTTYRDVANTNADWNTLAGELRLFTFTMTGVGSYDTSGSAGDVAVSGDYAFLADNPNVVIFDITDPTNPIPLATFAASNAAAVDPEGDVLYVGDGFSGLTIVDITDPTAPVQLANFPTPNPAHDVCVRGDLAYVACDNAGVLVIDVTDPANPVQVGGYDTPGSALRVDVSGDHCYVADRFGSGILVLDVTDPTSPTLAGGLVLAGDTFSVVVDGDFAYVGDAAAGLVVLDVSDPTTPALLGSIDPGSVRQVGVAGNFVYAAGYDMVHAIDVSDPTNPSLIDSWDNPGIASAVAVDGEHAFVADGAAGGLQILRISHVVPNPLEIASLSQMDYAQDVAVAGDHAFVVDGDFGLRVIDISNPMNPVEVGSISPQFPPLAIDVAGDLAFIVDPGSGLRVIDVSEPSNPVEIGSESTVGGLDVITSGNHAFIGGSSHLVVVDVSDPTNPVPAGSLNVGSTHLSVKIAGNLAFLSSFNPQGVQLVDISDPTAPSLITTLALGSNPVTALNIAGDHLFAVATPYLFSVDVSNPAVPAVVDSLPGIAGVFDVELVENYAFLVASTELIVVDISDPANLVEIGFVATPDQAIDIAIAGNHGFLAMADAGLGVLQCFQRELDALNDRAQSIVVDTADDNIIRARLNAQHTDTIDWELSADGGGNWQSVSSGNTWNAIADVGNDLLWRSTHAWAAPGSNPTASELTLDWLLDPPNIDAVLDIPNDQGRQVRVEWTRSAHDFSGDPQQIVEYAIYREIDAELSSNAMRSVAVESDVLSPAAREHASKMQSAGWDFLMSVPVRVEDYYAAVVPTLADSTVSEGLYSTTFRVSALTSTPGVFFDSHPGSGYSLDNLAPGVPQSFAIEYFTGSGNALSWDSAEEPDFQYYRIYRSSSPEFTPSPNDLVQETASPAWTDPEIDGDTVYYKITAVDFAGNESEPASAATVTDVPRPTDPERFALHGNVPNPFNPKTVIQYEVPAGGAPIEIVVYDAAGRRVRTLARSRETAGNKQVIWDGRNDEGHLVATGVYFYRMTGGDFVRTRKMLLLK